MINVINCLYIAVFVIGCVKFFYELIQLIKDYRVYLLAKYDNERIQTKLNAYACAAYESELDLTQNLEEPDAKA